MRGEDVGSGLKDRSHRRACGSEGRWRSGLTSSLNKGSRYLSVERGEVLELWQNERQSC